MDEPLVETEVADSEPQRRSGPWKLIAIVAVITLVAVWLVPDDEPEEQASVAPPPATQPRPTQETAAPPPSLLDRDTAGKTEAKPATGTEAGPGPADTRPGAKARALIANLRAESGADPGRALAAARNSQIAGELTDAYLLYFFAAREGSSTAALELGKQADPATRDPLSSVFEGPDYNQAHKWYQMAATGGSTEARDRLADLRKRVEQLAASGDPQAQRISLLWQ